MDRLGPPVHLQTPVGMAVTLFLIKQDMTTISMYNVTTTGLLGLQHCACLAADGHHSGLLLYIHAFMSLL